MKSDDTSDKADDRADRLELSGRREKEDRTAEVRALLHLHPWGCKYLVCLAVTSPTQGTVTHRSRRKAPSLQSAKLLD